MEYQIPNTRLLVMLQGTTNVNPGGTVSFRHPRFGTLVFALDDVTIHKVDTTQALFTRKLRTAVRSGSADEIMSAADWAFAPWLVGKILRGMQGSL